MSTKVWTKIDRTEFGLKDLLYLDPCFYYLVHTSEGYGVPSNSRIKNFKHEPERFRNNAAVWKHKTEAIEDFAQDVAEWLSAVNMAGGWGNVALVPMPTSKPSSHEFFDSRLVDLCNRVAQLDPRVRVENILDMSEAVTGSHKGGSRDIGFLKSKIIVRKPSRPLGVVILVDDMVTTGSHYVASSERLRETFFGIGLVGLFLSRHREKPE